MKTVKVMQLLVVLPLIALLGACATNKATSKPVEPPVSKEEFMQESVEKQKEIKDAHLKNVKASGQWDHMDFISGNTVCYENGSCTQWNQISRTVAVWFEHSTGPFGIDTSAVQTFPTDEDGNVINDRGAILAHANDQAGFGRWAIGQLTSILAPLGNGYLGAKINKCGGNCGGSGVLNQIMVEAISGSSATNANTSNSTNTVGVCPTGGCP